MRKLQLLKLNKIYDNKIIYITTLIDNLNAKSVKAVERLRGVRSLSLTNEMKKMIVLLNPVKQETSI